MSWKLGLTAASSEDVEGKSMKPFVFVNMEVEEGKKQENICFDMSFEEFKHLHKELKVAKKKMLTS